MTKKLELTFGTADGSVSTISVDEPKEPIDIAEVITVMEEMIASEAVQSTKGKLANVKGARLVERTVTDYEIV
ncbi:DUF2922 domain-containing protein [Cytobacillus kochii]|uniref:DUF2922 domain-containing protein n=1 Tax=Cytobacillus kochii TaxID=859143 RepID=UPI00203BDC9D|nr:DUF2922 domain-containing protein [Cytobacillus kochii]MCM3321563.1 DUF2922 domain-containing protein [Cytobacillus kochii]MCM3343603.1 DUF2922 domain-containing protein [Cytobacillus kochii]